MLIDALWADFAEMENLWEPLDVIMERLGVTEELVPSVLELGKIHGVQYGVMTDFRLSTLVTGNRSLKEWDYDALLQCMADSTELEEFFNIYGGGNFGANFIMDYLCNGIDDARFWDAEAGKTDFDSSEFRQALELAEKYCTPKEEVPHDKGMLEEGKVLVNEVNIRSPRTLRASVSFMGKAPIISDIPPRMDRSIIWKALRRWLSAERLQERRRRWPLPSSTSSFPTRGSSCWQRAPVSK